MIAQLGIAVLGVSAVFLVGCKRPDVKRWGYVCGIAAQPFWLVETIAHEQYLITALCGFYGYSWLRGLRNHWKVTPPIARGLP
jgi:GTPase